MRTPVLLVAGQGDTDAVTARCCAGREPWSSSIDSTGTWSSAR